MLNLLNKIRRIIKNNPVILSRKIINKLPRNMKKWLLRFPNDKRMENQLNKIRETHKGKTLYVFPLPSCPWGYMFQRPQQLARGLARKGNVVFYMVDTSFPHGPDWYVRGISEIESNVYLVNDNNKGKLFAKVFSEEELNIWQYWPHQLDLIKEWNIILNKTIKIYDCIDHIETFLSYPNIKDDFLKSIMDADILLASAKNIQKDLMKIREDCLYIPNGVNFNDFVGFTGHKWEGLEKIKSESKTIIGYYGAIAEWFDFKTIEYIANKNPNWTILLVGEIYPTVLEKVKEFERYKNVKFLDRVDYKYIPQLLSIFDVAILPFRLNNITLSTSPVKIFEYVAGGKPVVSSPLPEVIDIDGIFIGNDSIEFNRLVSVALSQKDNKEFSTEMRQIAQENTWDKRIETVLQFQKGLY